MNKENIEVYNLTVVELESRELSKSEAEIAIDESFTDSISNIAGNVIEELKSMCDEVKFGLHTNEDNTVYRVAIKVAYKENTTTKLAIIKDFVGTLISVITRYINIVDTYKTELDNMLNEVYPENETRESDSQLEETEEE